LSRKEHYKSIMKLQLLLSTAILLTIISTPSNAAEVNAADKVALKKINDLLEKFKEKGSMNHQLSPVVAVIAKSFDEECMLEKYKEHNFAELVPTDEMMAVGGLRPIAAMSAFIDVALLCNNKTDALLKFMFENYMSHEVLFKAFIGEPEFKHYADVLKCANKHAIEMKLLDPSMFDIDVEMTEEKCKEMIVTSNAQLIQSVEKQTQKNITAIAFEVEEFALKYGLLIQVELTQEQKIEERAKFVMDAHKILEDILKYLVEQILENGSDIN